MRHPDYFADEEHRRFIALAFSDDDRAVDRHGIHDPPHRLDGDLLGMMTVALPHGVGAGDGRLLDDAQEFKGQV